MTISAPAHDTAARLAAQRSRFLQFLRTRVADPANAEDILQAAYVKAIERGAQLRATESSVAWFYRILRNAIADYYRRQAASSRAMDQWTADWNEAYEPELEAEVCACIQEALRALRPAYRVAIQQVDLGGESIDSFARAQRTTANNASVRLHRARTAVAKQIVAICGANSIHECADCTCRR